jgi:hypothetical protein
MGILRPPSGCGYRPIVCRRKVLDRRVETGSNCKILMDTGEKVVRKWDRASRRRVGLARHSEAFRRPEIGHRFRRLRRVHDHSLDDHRRIHHPDS